MLLRQFDRLLDAPAACDSLRQFIYDLAISGRLVSQDPTDEPSEALLAHSIAAQLARRPPSKRTAAMQVPSESFELPPGWVWSRLGELGAVFNGNSVSDEEKGRLRQVRDGLPFIATKDVAYGRDPLDYDNGLRVPTSDTRFRIAPAGAVLVCAEGGSAGRKSGVTDRPICFGNKLYAVDPSPGVEPLYLLALYQTSWFYGEFKARMRGIIGGIPKSAFTEIPVPLPPTAEQQRIIAKTEELIDLCDELKVAQINREVVRASLRRASSERFASETTEDEHRSEDSRFFVGHLARMVARPEHVQAIRQAVLDLAVRGRLVPQDSSEEPAIQVVARVSAETKFRGTSAALPDDLRELPDGWCWARVGRLAQRVTVGHVGTTAGWYVPTGVPFLRSQNVRVNRFSEAGLVWIDPSRDQELSKSRIRPGDVLVVRSGANRGMACVAPEELGEANCADLVIVQRPSGIDSRLPRLLHQHGHASICTRSRSRYGDSALQYAIPVGASCAVAASVRTTADRRKG